MAFPDFVIPPPEATGDYTPGSHHDLYAQPVVTYAPGLAIVKGTIVVQGSTGTTLPGGGYHVAIRDCILGSSAPAFNQSNEDLHFSKGPSA